MKVLLLVDMLVRSTKKNSLYQLIWGWLLVLLARCFSLRTTDIFCWILSCGGFPGHCRTVSSIPGLYTLDVNRIIPQRCDNQKSFQMWPNGPHPASYSQGRGQNHPIKNHC